MLFSKTIKLLICLVIILPYIVQAPQASAAVATYDHDALLEYEGYGQAMYETIVDQTTFLTGQYTDNKNFVSSTIDEVQDYAKFWWNEYSEMSNLPPKEKFRAMFEVGGGYALTVGDWVKKLFTGFGEKQGYESFDSAMDDLFYITQSWSIGSANNYGMKFYGPNLSRDTTYISNFGWSCSDNNCRIQGLMTENIDLKSSANVNEMQKTLSNLRANNRYSDLVRYLAFFAINVDFYKLDDNAPVIPKHTDFARFNSGLGDTTNKQLIMPQPKAFLTCPDGSRIDMAINGSNFLDSSGKIMQVGTNGIATINSQTCNLEWEKPKVDYVDDKAAITDPDGNWLDILTGEMLECVLLDKCEVSKPDDDKEDIEPLDGSLVEYVKNAYEYATNVLKTGTDGLKSLATGAKELTALFGVFFGWLPKEMVVLMSSGLAIAVGLRLFRK